MNKQQILRNRPATLPDNSTWELISSALPQPAADEVLVKTHYVSIDPAMRGWMMDRKSYLPPVQIGEVMRAGTVGEVIESNGHPTFHVGDILSGWGGVQQYFTTSGEMQYKVDTSMLPMAKYLGVLGMPGMTAYFGILDVGKIKEGDVVVISGAAGAVGSLAGQIAKIKGCRVIGIAGGPAKCNYVAETLGFDACVDYKANNVYNDLSSHCPQGIDVYFDNVGGTILDAVLAQIRLNARVVLCGAISQYNSTEVYGPKNYLSLLINRGTMQGMVVLDYVSRYQEAGAQIGQWMMQGKIQSEETIIDGIENLHPTFLRLFNGDKRGKLLLKVIED